MRSQQSRVHFKDTTATTVSITSAIPSIASSGVQVQYDYPLGSQGNINNLPKPALKDLPRKGGNKWGENSNAGAPHDNIAAGMGSRKGGKNWGRVEHSGTSYENISHHYDNPSTTAVNNVNIGHTNTQSKHIKQHDILVLMDSNRKHINFDNLFVNDKVRVVACGNVEHASVFVHERLEYLPKTVLIHLGTNDLNVVSPQQYLSALLDLVQYLESKGCKVLVSELLPRTDGNRGMTDKVNIMLKDLFPEISRIPHPNISHAHLYDEVHLRRNVNNGDQFSGVQLLSIDFYRAVYHCDPMGSRISRSLGGDHRRPSSRERRTGRGEH